MMTRSHPLYKTKTYWRRFPSFCGKFPVAFAVNVDYPE